MKQLKIRQNKHSESHSGKLFEYKKNYHKKRDKKNFKFFNEDSGTATVNAWWREFGVSLLVFIFTKSGKNIWTDIYNNPSQQLLMWRKGRENLKSPILAFFCCLSIGYIFGIFPVQHPATNGFPCTFSRSNVLKYFDILFHKFGIQRGKTVLLKCELSMRSFFVTIWMLILDWVGRRIETHNGLFCFCIWWCCRKMEIMQWNELRG